jgi:nitrile hydratase
VSDDHGDDQSTARRVTAIESLLVEKGLITSDVVDAVVETYERDVGPLNGAKVVARAWVDGAFRKRLLDDGTQAIGELGFGGAEGEHLVVLENTSAVHNVVVCTLCSCYPWPVLGLPPRWYKSFAYRPTSRSYVSTTASTTSDVISPFSTSSDSMAVTRRAVD